jgi:hypothetical protein
MYAFLYKNGWVTPRVKNVSRIRKKTFYLQFCMGTPEGHQISIFNTSKVKKKQRPQKRKKVIETPNRPIEIKKCVAYPQEDFLFIKLITSFTISLLNNCKKDFQF